MFTTGMSVQHGSEPQKLKSATKMVTWYLSTIKVDIFVVWGYKDSTNSENIWVCLSVLLLVFIAGVAVAVAVPGI